jgi:hypothetical protein
MPFWQLSAPQGHFKRERRTFCTVAPKSKEFAAKMLVLHVVLHARVLHVGCMCFLRYFLCGLKSPWLAARFRSLLWNFRGRRKILSGKHNTFEQ